MKRTKSFMNATITTKIYGRQVKRWFTVQNAAHLTLKMLSSAQNVDLPFKEKKQIQVSFLIGSVGGMKVITITIEAEQVSEP